jgi:hypothetical protein
MKRHKNDATDAEAICEAVTRPNMRFVATKTPAQQGCPTPAIITPRVDLAKNIAGGR